MSRFRFVLPALAAVFLFALLLLWQDTAASAASEALRLCAERIIPSLFPFMALSSVFVSLDLLRPLDRLVPAKAFHLPPCAGSVLLTGLLCGFPVGASTACRLYAEGRLTRNEAARLTALSSCASPAFLIGTVGTLWNSRAFGVFLYTIQTSVTLTLGLFPDLPAPFFRKSGERTAERHPPFSDSRTPRIASVFCRSITDAALGCLNVTAYVTFFRIAAALIARPVPALSPVISAVFEFSSGCAAGAALGSRTGAFLTGFSAGLGGLSVLMQITAYTDPHGIPAVHTAAFMPVRGIIMGLLSLLFFAFPFNNFLPGT